MFMVDLGFSPFMSLYNNQDCVHACILADNFDMMQYIVKNSKLVKGDEHNCRYDVPEERRNDYIMQRNEADECGNNALHHIFNTNETSRWKYLECLISEGVGDTNEMNINNYLPHQIEHS